ncbi:GNAT family N-acetyltransferase [Pseudomonas sp. MAFF 302030]|jgi:N-acetylglutamate synthase-like GNAT family acetyltransferase|uniref:GNAT family N-acetyltransferase n=1 Tax=Pseudomonas morbosilactucae TaxID=2938197 RepID=A0A9X1YWP7_9PSED|nr:GNAT family N-acetyltransferase [Pseudomonas morbosilactucae]MCK9799079.1 GNAT family N-acetyltransferase [Pseudomonas morbosilactucae]
MPEQIRLALENDAPQISQVIVAALLTSNAQDYPPSVIERVQRSFTAEAILELMKRRRMFVATRAGKVIGTASLDGAAVRSVFVEPSLQRAGIGQRLMEAVQAAAQEAGVKVLRVPSSLTAEGFYRRLGFQVVGEQVEGEERTLIMQRTLP